MSYGAPMHFKSCCDTMFGIISRLCDSYCKRKRLVSLEEVVNVCQAWGDDEMNKFPDGPKFYMIHLDPDVEERTTVYSQSPGYTSESVFGVDDSWAWTFTTADKRGRGWRGTGTCINTLTNIRVANNRLTDVAMATVEGRRRPYHPEIVVDTRDIEADDPGHDSEEQNIP